MTDSQQPNEYSKRIFSNNLKGLDAYTRHKKFMNDYVFFYGRNNERKFASTLTERPKSEFDILKENHKFLRPQEEEEDLTWEQRVAKKYYDKLFKEYCIADLKYYKEGKIALRWRIEKEVITGKGQLICASTKCSEKHDLKSWEVNFAYIEDGEKKNALVKIRLCPKCSVKLNYKNRHQEARQEELSTDQEKRHENRKRKSHENWGERDQRDDTDDHDVVSSKRNKTGARSSQGEIPQTANATSTANRSEEFDEYFTGLFD
ncbi:18631_t:CDS:2 [Acaulospora morrowiae]|uniref:18631_t:CDS:1 n=1 Tax=Acaulospora morrowiae TaxID=94023 RepID=A0A9N9F7Q9_9GLOM|nr:18631_t:CDS:2 [Acaulospora morrowiae]